MDQASQLASDLKALLARVEAESGPLLDPTLLPVADGRIVAERNHRRWNVNLPEMAQSLDVWIDSVPGLGSAPVRARALIPDDAKPGLLVFVHGGGFAFCSPETHERCARLLAIEAGVTVLVPDYRLAPEHPYPSGLNDVIASLRGAPKAAAAIGAKPGALLIAGDSAGANLALAAMLHEQAESRAVPEGALLFYGTFATDFGTPSYLEFADGPGLTRGRMQRFWQWYCGGKDISNEVLACPLNASDEALASLPPLHLVAAAIDPLLSDSVQLEARLRALKRSDGLKIAPGMTHGFLQYSSEIDLARATLAAAGAAAREMIAGTG